MDLSAIEHSLKAAIGKKRVVSDYVSPSIVERLAVTLESGGAAPSADAPLPPGWHNVFCLQAPSRSALGQDGLPAVFDQIPPVPMQRRMFGGARMTFHAPLRVGEAVRCESEVADAKLRTTAAGHLAIVTLRLRYLGSSGLCVTEEQDIVHMEPTPASHQPASSEKPAAASESLPVPTWSRQFTPDPVMLFRFSALTFNSHRIHYDLPYSSEVEKLPGLMVQGKLIALQLLETVRSASPSAKLTSFEYRSGRPLFADGRPCTLAAGLDASRLKAKGWASDAEGRAVQTASMTFGEPAMG